MLARPRILVVGSFVMDLITSTRVFPHSGETVLGARFTTAPGGKGANQAIQAALLGADVTMVGKVGADGFGKELLASMRNAGVDVSHVAVDPTESSAIGNITLEIGDDGNSHNRIIVVSGANMTITPSEVAFLQESIGEYDMVMMQFEIPMEINELVAGYAYAKGVPVMVNPAPAAKIPDSLLCNATYLSPNEHEAALLTGVALGVEQGVDTAAIREMAKRLLKSNSQYLLVTLGENGAAIANAEGVELVPAVPNVSVADPTADGDSFVGAFCTGVCAGLTHRAALDFARSHHGVPHWRAAKPAASRGRTGGAS